MAGRLLAIDYVDGIPLATKTAEDSRCSWEKPCGVRVASSYVLEKVVCRMS